MNALPNVARIGTHLFTFCEYLDGQRSWGRAVRTGIAKWYLDRTENSLGLQLAKYQQRNGWSHRDVLRLAHVKSDYAPVKIQNALRWSLGKDYDRGNIPHMITCADLMKDYTEDVDKIIDLIETFQAPRELVPTQHLKDRRVWWALLPHMGAEAMVRNLGNMSSYGVFEDPQWIKFVADKLNDQDYIQKQRLHPIKSLLAKLQYQQGHGMRGDNRWPVIRQIDNALENAFYLGFKAVTPTGLRWCYALDVSGSMSMGDVGNIPGFTPCMATAAMSLVLANVEKDPTIIGFADRIKALNIKPNMRLEEAMSNVSRQNFGGTDASLAFQWAASNGKDFDAFCMMTDSETWAGRIHPFVALNTYRRGLNHRVSLITMAFTATSSTIGDTSDPNSLDVVGFDTAVPELISNFVTL